VHRIAIDDVFSYVASAAAASAAASPVVLVNSLVTRRVDCECHFLARKHVKKMGIETLFECSVSVRAQFMALAAQVHFGLSSKIKFFVYAGKPDC